MCDFDWTLFLEYLKVFLSWPPMVVLVALILIYKFRDSIDNFLKRLVEANVAGSNLKAVPPREQQDAALANQDGLSNAVAEAEAETRGDVIAEEQLPPELANDPLAPSVIHFVRNNPAQTVIEYKRINFYYNSERLFNLIYGTQVALLESLASDPEKSVKLSQLARFHAAHQSLSGRTDYQLRDYMSFLVTFECLSVSGPLDDSDYKITPHGLEFLSYIKANYATAWNQRAF